jgi:hypothetical protein
MFVKKLLWAGVAYGLYRLFRGSKRGIGIASSDVSTEETRQHI